MQALVTGGAGFIGSTLVDRLVGAGHQVCVVDDLSSGVAANLATGLLTGQVELVEHDIRDAATVDLVASRRPEVVFHLAAQADVRVSVSDPVLDAMINVIGTLQVFEGARHGGARKVVFASSGGTIYGEPDPAHLPVDESHSQHPLSPYGVSKKVGSDYLAAYAALHGLDWTSLALANVYGPRQDPHGEAGVVAIFAGRLLGGERCTIFGDGEQTRDFVYVEDVARAFELAAGQGVAEGLICNIGTGVETSVNQLYAAMAAAAGVDEPAENAPARPGELARSALDSTRARRELGWTPEVGLDEGARRVLAWFAGRTD